MRGISEADLIARVTADYRRPFDLTRNPVRASLYTRADDDHVLLVAIALGILVGVRLTRTVEAVRG